jgi:fructokinase
MLTVIGENIIDLVPLEADNMPLSATQDDAPVYKAYPGGSPANVAVAASRLGTPTALMARISRDVFGQRVRARLAADRVDDRYLVTAREPSSLAVVTFDDERRATYDFWLNGTADWQWKDAELPSPLAPDVTALHVGSLAAFLEPGASAITRLLRSERERGNVTISLDPNIRPAIVGGPDGDLAPAREQAERLVALAHVVKASDEDLATLYPGRSLQESAAAWLALGPSLVVVTRGQDGALAVGRSATLAVPAPLVEIADTVGAGDTFSGALLHSLSEAGLLGAAGMSKLGSLDAAELRPIITAAVAAAAINCTRPGTNPPTAAELAAFLAM